MNWPALVAPAHGDRAVVADDADGVAVDHRAAADGLVVVFALELEEFAAIDDARDDFAAVVGLAVVHRHHAAEFLDVVERRAHRQQLELRALRIPVEVLDDLARDADAVGVVLGEEFGGAGDLRVHLGAAQVFVLRDFTGRGLQQRRAGQKHLGLLAHHDHVVRQTRACRRRRQWTNHAPRVTCGMPAADSTRLVGKGLAAGDEQFGLVHQVGAAGLDHGHARQLLLQRDLLDAQTLLHAPRRHRAALDGEVAGVDHAAHAGDVADAGDVVAARQRAVLVVVILVAAQRLQFQPGRAAVQHQVHALARQQLAALVEALALAFLFRRGPFPRSRASRRRT